MVLKEFEAKLDGVVNFEVAPDNIGHNVNRGFGFCTFKDQDACKVAHAKHESIKLEILVSASASPFFGLMVSCILVEVDWFTAVGVLLLVISVLCGWRLFVFGMLGSSTPCARGALVCFGLRCPVMGSGA